MRKRFHPSHFQKIGFVRKPAVTFSISGITRDASAIPLGSCSVKLFRTDTDALVASTTSDASTGAYTFALTPEQCSYSYYVVAYKSGAIPVGGTSLNTLRASAT